MTNWYLEQVHTRKGGSDFRHGELTASVLVEIYFECQTAGG